jgi:hypothetical protein
MEDRSRRFLGKVLVAVASFAAAVAVGLQGAGVWDASPGEQVAVAVAVALLALGSSVGAAVSELSAQRSDERRTKVAFILEALGFAVQDATGIDFRDLGLAAYVLERPLFRRQERLVRLHRVRPRASPGVSGVDWHPGKGVIGMCVVEGRDIGYDISELDADIAGTTREHWAALSDDERLGLTYDEWLLLREKFGVVVATPVVRERSGRSSTVGCVALDGPAGQIDVLFSDEVRAQLQSAATSLERVVL